MSGSDTPQFSQFKALLFDCYGTLVDWEDGLYTALLPLLQRLSSPLAAKKSDALLAFLGVERDLQAKYPTMLYKDILALCHAELAARLMHDASPPDGSQAVGVTELSAHPGGSTKSEMTTAESSAAGDNPYGGRSLTEENIAFGSSIAKWQSFPDTIPALASLSKHFKLTVLSNVDRESFNATRAILERSRPEHQFTFDAIYTAQDIGSYKPDIANFQYAIRQLKEEFGVDKAEVLVTACSLYHDHVPANILGLKSAYIARPDAILGQDSSARYDWKFGDLEEMANAVDQERKSGSYFSL